MSNPTISQLKAALQRQGVNVSNLSDIQIRQMCNERLAMSLTGNRLKRTDSFFKKYEYNFPYKLPSGESIYVAELGSFKLPSGKIINAYVDLAGKQYFQYFDENKNELQENVFKLSEYTLHGKDIQYMNGKLYTSNFLNIKEIKAQKITKDDQINDNHPIVIKGNDDSLKNHYLYSDCDLDFDSNDKVDMNQFSISRLKQKFPSSKYNIKSVTDPNKLPNRFIKQTIAIMDKQGNVLRDIKILTNDDITYKKFDGGNNITTYSIKNGEINGIQNFNKNNNMQEGILYEEIMGVKCKVITSGNDAKLTTTYYNTNNEIIRSLEKYNNDKIICRDYINGILNCTSTYQPSTNFFEIKYNAVDLMNEVYNGYFYSKLNEDAAEKLMKLLDKNNVIKYCMEFSKLHNKDFITFLYSKGFDSKDKHRERLIKHIEKCLEYQPYKKITNSQVKTKNYTSPYVYDVVFDGNQVSIYNKTTNKTSKIDIDKIFNDCEKKFDKLAIISVIQKLPGEILEFIANEKISLISLYDDVSKKIQAERKKSGLERFAGMYRGDLKPTIVIPNEGTLVHELGHAVDNMIGMYMSERSPQMQQAFLNGRERYKADGYPVHSHTESDNTTNREKPDYYFSTNAQECWSRVFELIYLGHCEGQEILEKYWAEFIAIEKSFIQAIQNAPDNLRHNNI